MDIDQLASSSFLISFKVLLECLTHLRGLTIKLQMQAMDVLYAYREVNHVISTLKAMRDTATSSFSVMFKEVSTIAQNLHGEEFQLTLPRLTSRQAHRQNVQSSSVEDYFRITLYNEFLSHLINELEERSSSTHTIELLYLLPSNCVSSESAELPDELAKAVDFYRNDLPHAVILPTEYRMWVAKWKQPDCNAPEKLVDALKNVTFLRFLTSMFCFNLP